LVGAGAPTYPSKYHLLGYLLQVVIDIPEGDFQRLGAAVIELHIVVLGNADASVYLDALDTGFALVSMRFVPPCLVPMSPANVERWLSAFTKCLAGR